MEYVVIVQFVLQLIVERDLELKKEQVDDVVKAEFVELFLEKLAYIISQSLVQIKPNILDGDIGSNFKVTEEDLKRIGFGNADILNKTFDLLFLFQEEPHLYDDFLEALDEKMYAWFVEIMDEVGNRKDQILNARIAKYLIGAGDDLLELQKWYNKSLNSILLDE